MLSSLLSTDATAFWPHNAIINVMKQVYDRVIHIEDDQNQRFYEVELKGLKFLAILVHEANAPEKIRNFGFMGYFAGFDISETGVEALNRNLHISVAEIDDQQNLILFSFFDANGTFDENRFSLILEAWHRDVVMTLKMITPTTNFQEALPARSLDIAKVYGVNSFPEHARPQKQPENISPSPSISMTAGTMSADMNETKIKAPLQTQNNTIDILKRFLGTSDASRALCRDCAGKGRKSILGSIIMRHCKSCDGSGLTAPTA